MFPDIGGGLGAKLVMASIVVAIALIVFFLAMRTWRRRGARTFLRGGKNRAPRLAVLDAAAVDQKRRLVLVRRDDVEHLILIGGPTDVVIESRIGAENPSDMGMPAPEMRVAEREEASFPERDAALPAATALAGREETETPVRPAETVAREEMERIADPQPAVPLQEEARPLSAPAPADHADAQQATPEREAKADVASILDDHRQRVFGASQAPEPSRPPEPSPYVRAYLDDEGLQKPVRTANAPEADAADSSSSVLRFEDFLDSEIASDLSSVQPEAPSRQQKPAAPSLGPQARGTGMQDSRSDEVLDEEMSRLLQQLSHRR